jgi:hypothetical protein
VIVQAQDLQAPTSVLDKFRKRGHLIEAVEERGQLCLTDGRTSGGLWAGGRAGGHAQRQKTTGVGRTAQVPVSEHGCINDGVDIFLG